LNGWSGVKAPANPATKRKRQPTRIIVIVIANNMWFVPMSWKGLHSLTKGTSSSDLQLFCRANPDSLFDDNVTRGNYSLKTECEVYYWSFLLAVVVFVELADRSSAKVIELASFSETELSFVPGGAASSFSASEAVSVSDANKSENSEAASLASSTSRCSSATVTLLFSPEIFVGSTSLVVEDGFMSLTLVVPYNLSVCMSER
jgi:hypothetical protein